MKDDQKFVFEERYRLGITVIDEQHKVLFKILNDLNNVLSSTPSVETIDKIIDELIKYKTFHFQTEEGYFKEFNYEKADVHIIQHSQFRKKINVLRDKCSGDSIAFAFELMDFLEDWLIGHLMTADQEYVVYFRAHGLK